MYPSAFVDCTSIETGGALLSTGGRAEDTGKILHKIRVQRSTLVAGVGLVNTRLHPLPAKRITNVLRYSGRSESV
jgi:hypothetical protein